MKATKIVKKVLEWYCESAALMYRPDHHNTYHELW